jgi:type II secretory pathway pseudopilin PulG
MSTRTGATLIETLVVFAIIGILLALSFPYVLSARRRALEAECQNNLHNINLALADYVQANKRLPGPGTKGMVGGWTIDVLPFLEQKNLWDQITPGTPLLTAPDFLLRQPAILSCPVRGASDEPINRMDQASYVFLPGTGHSFNVIDVPLGVKTPWASGLEMSFGDVVRQTGPHQGGFFYARGFQNGVEFIDGETTFE